MPRDHSSRAVHALCVAMAGVAAVAYRSAAFNGFANDHYMHLAWAQQVVRGAVPGRDFMEPGMPLTIALSAAAQAVGGRGLLAEFVLCVTLIAVTAAVTCWLAIRLTDSPVLGLCAAALQIAIFPRLYNYPKLLVPVVGLTLLWAYVDRPTGRRAALVGAWLTVAFLFRHDYVLYLGLGALAAFLVAGHARGGWQRLREAVICAAVAGATVLPYLIALSASGGLETHLRDGIEFTRSEAYQWAALRPPPFTRSAPEVPSRETLPVAGPLRSAARVLVLDVAVPLGVHVNGANASVLLFYAAFVLPVILLGLSWRRASHPDDASGDSARRTFVLAVLALALTFGLLRHPLDARLPDLAGLMPLVLVGAAAALRRHVPTVRALAPVLVGSALVVVFLHGSVWGRLYGAGTFSGPRAVAARYSQTWSVLRTPPWDRLWPVGRLPDTIRYVRACTPENERVLVTWFAPEVFTFADRGFASGHAYFSRRSFFARDYQQRMVAQLEYERPAVVLINKEQDWFRRRFVHLQDYLDDHYRVVGYDRHGHETVAVAVRHDRRPPGIYPPTGWPCFVSRTD